MHSPLFHKAQWKHTSQGLERTQGLSHGLLRLGAQGLNKSHATKPLQLHQQQQHLFYVVEPRTAHDIQGGAAPTLNAARKSPL